MAKQLQLSMGMLAFFVAGALVLMGAISSADATCTAVNHSDKPIQIQLLRQPLTVNATATVNATNVVDVAANATLTFVIDATPAAISLVNKVTNNVSPVLFIVDNSLLRIEAAVGQLVNVFLDVMVGTNLVNVATLVNNL